MDKLRFKGVCLILSAPSGGGKTTIIRKLMQENPDLVHSISYTTRAPRNDQADKEDYHFISKLDFERLVEQNAFLEWAEVHGHYYGTRRDDLFALLEKGVDVLMDIDIQGAAQLKKSFPEGVQVFVLPPSMKVLEKRLKDRASENIHELKKRLDNAIEEIKAYINYDYVVVNDDLSETVDKVRCIIHAEHCKRNVQFIDISNYWG